MTVTDIIHRIVLSFFVLHCLTVNAGTQIAERDCQRGDGLPTPSNISCMYLDFKIVSCTWSLEREQINNSCNSANNTSTSMHVYYTVSETPIPYNCDNLSYSPSLCVESDAMMCSWRYNNNQTFKWLAVKVFASNNITNTRIGSCRKFNLVDITRPPQVKNLAVIQSSEAGCMSVDWNQQQIHTNYTCKLKTRSKCKTEMTKIILFVRENPTQFAQKICNLHPFDMTSLSVSCQLKSMNKEMSFWSKISTVSFRVQKEVPNSFPNTTDGLYEVGKPTKRGLYSLTYYFRPLSDCELHDNPIMVSYCLQVKGSDVCVRHPKFSINAYIPYVKKTELKFIAMNGAGLSKKIKQFAVYSEDLAPAPSDLNIEITRRQNENLVAVTANPKEKAFKLIYHTIVVCEDFLVVCKVPLKWFILNTLERNFTMTLGNTNVRFGLITHAYNDTTNDVISTGIRWSNSVQQSSSHAKGSGVQETSYIVSGTVFMFFVIFILCIVCKRGRNCVFSTKTEQSVNNAADGGEERQTLLERRRKRCQDRRGTTNQNISLAEKLLNSDTLPKNEDLQSLYKVNGKETETLKVCENVCSMIKNKLGDVVTNIWTARNLSSGKIAFVVESRKMIDIKTIFQSDLEIILHHCDITKEKESRKVMERERECLEKGTDELFDNIKMLQKCTSRYSKDLMDKHKNITAILPCVIKSKGFGTPDEHDLLEVLCISIHVKKKVSGLIPLDEEPIPELVDGFPTDVVQGESRIFGNGPNDYHRNLKIGSAIHAEVKNNKGCILGGTLGCFVRHETYGMCCITNAHVVLSNENLQLLLKCNYMEYGNYGVSVFQPLNRMSASFGKVVAVAYNEGHSECAGVEGALIKMLDRLPISGSFPQAASEKVPTFTFNSGSVTDASLLKPYTAVFKFGMETEQTIGKLGIPGAFVRYDEGIQLQNQLVVFPAQAEAFAAPGDSGSSVFIGYSKPGTESVIGLISGGLDNGTVFVTPIHDVLQSLKCQPYLYRFENSNDSGINVSMPPGGEEYMDCN